VKPRKKNGTPLSDDELLAALDSAEQQALAKHGLNFVIDEYLPTKLKAVTKFLP
jgi:hypothetical protein